MSDFWPFTREIRIPYDPLQRELYLQCSPACIYDFWPNSLWHGRARKHGEFALMVARHHFLQMGYTVWVSEPRFPKCEGYILTSYPGYREKQAAPYKRMADMFGLKNLEALNRHADGVKRRLKGNRGGGDPDLFVFKGDGRRSRMFVEVKLETSDYNDVPNRTQLAVFPLIESRLPVKVRLARVYPFTA
ncbi:MAG: VRR-NUC domain-containing protein [Acidobacteriales bacterium]|nr:VRR-NUC domain-containing protein [Terriglobales bacterium]